MAKFLVLLFVIVHFLNVSLMYFNDIDSTWSHTMPMWVGIGILAICQSIEKSKEVDK